MELETVQPADRRQVNSRTQTVGLESRRISIQVRLANLRRRLLARIVDILIKRLHNIADVTSSLERVLRGEKDSQAKLRKELLRFHNIGM